MMLPRTFCLFLATLVPLAHATPQSADDDTQEPARASWSNWRGPSGTGVAPEGNPPAEWSEEKNIRWKVDLPGVGCSSPIIWKDRVYVTTAIEAETEEEGEATPESPPPQEEEGRRGRGRRGGFGGGPPPTTVHEFVVLAFERKDGSVAWRTKVTEAVPHEGGHSTASQASNSPLTDGEHIYAHFGSRGLYCLDMQGEVQWSKQFGSMRTRMQFGEGSSPALFGNTLVVNWDHEGDSFIVAMDKRTGAELWSKERDESTSWGTPLIVSIDEKPQAIVCATGATRGYDLKDGEVLWSSSGMTANCVPTPVYADGVVYVMSGFRGSAMQALRLAGARGDLSESEHLEWSLAKNTSYVPSALLYDGYLYILRTNSGVLTCLDAKTGAVHYQGQRLEGTRTVYSSPVGARGRVYVTSREGTTVVVKLGKEFEQVAVNELDDVFDASAAISDDELYLRGREHLYCIAEP